MAFLMANSLSIWITDLVFSDGSCIKCSQNDVFVIVGPNNSGKSAALRGIRDRLQDPARSSPVITQLKTSRTGTDADLIRSLEAWAMKNLENQPGNPMFGALGIGLHEQ